MSIALKIMVLLHVLSAVAGLGPSFALPILGMTVGRNPETAVTLAPILARIAKMPKHGGIAALLTGLAIVGLSGWNLLSQFWIIGAIVLTLTAAAIATTQSEPRINELNAMVKAGPIDPAKVRGLLAPVGKVGRINMILLLLILILMVFKPSM